MDIPIPPVFLRHNAFASDPQPVTPILTPALPTHLTLSHTTLPLRRLRVTPGLRRHEVAITHRSTTVFVTPAASLHPFHTFISTLHQLSISPRHYTFTRLLARGAFGSVHSAITPSHACLAVKRIPLSNPLWRAERDILRQLPPHDNVVPVLDTFTAQHHLHIVMPRLTPLSALPLPLRPSRALPLLRSLLAAVAHLHKAGVCHNDIKPDNLLLSADGREVVVTDFGFASYGRRRGGTTAYALGSGPGGDVWSVGVVGFVLLAGRLPWADAKEKAAVLKRMKSDGSAVVGELMDGVSVGEDVIGLLKGLLQVDGGKRLSARAALEHEVFGGRQGGRWGIASVFTGVLFGVRLDSLTRRRKTLLL